MILGGFQKLTLIDYPGKLATTVFTVGCSLRCPFCHNPELVHNSQFPPASQARALRAGAVHSNLEKEFFDFLKKRKGKLEGVCITGGEPLIQKDIIDFIKKIKKFGFLVKLDTNGTRPDVLRKIIQAKLVDFIAMDIKNQPKKYSKTSGIKTPASTRSRSSTRGGDIERIKLSVNMIMGSGIDYEFRTTAVPGLHSEKDFEEIAKWIAGAKAYYLQEYREIKILDPRLKAKTKGKKLDLEKIKSKIEKSFGKVGIRR